MSASESRPGRVPVAPSENHTVLVALPVKPGSVPQPCSPTPDAWDDQHVRLPCSPQSLYPVPQPGGTTQLKQRWAMVEEALLGDIRTAADLENAIKSYNLRYKDRWDFSGLRYFIEDVLSDEESDFLFSDTIPQLAALALRLPELVPSPLPLLRRHQNRSITMSQQQVACLLANAFFCTYPRRNATKQAEYSSFPEINFNRLFVGMGKRRQPRTGCPRRIEKLKCLLHYFHRVLKHTPTGLLTFTRRYVPAERLPNWAESGVRLSGLRCESEGFIEDQANHLQMDFANKFVGGGVLGSGCVQEEIRFVIDPELIVSMLFTEVLDRTECLIATGCERFSSVTGYADSFQWEAKTRDTTPVDQFGRRLTQVVMLDAFHFHQARKQYELPFLTRELNKAYAGFSVDEVSGPEDQKRLPAVATGNWGCGVFNGNPRFKALLQLMAAAVAGRDLTYLTFGDVELRDDLRSVYSYLTERGVTVGRLHSALSRYGRLVSARGRVPEILSFIYEHFSAETGSDMELEIEEPSSGSQQSQEPVGPAPGGSKAGSDTKLSATAGHTLSDSEEGTNEKSEAKLTTSITDPMLQLYRTTPAEGVPNSDMPASLSDMAVPGSDAIVSNSDTTAPGPSNTAALPSDTNTSDTTVSKSDTGMTGADKSTMSSQKRGVACEQQEALAGAYLQACFNDSEPCDLDENLRSARPEVRSQEGQKRVRRDVQETAEETKTRGSCGSADEFARFELISETAQKRDRDKTQSKITEFFKQ